VNFGRTWSSRLPGLRELFREARDADALEGALTRLGNSLHDPQAVYDSPRRPARSSRLPPPRPGWSHDLGREGGPVILGNGTGVGPAAAVRPRVATGQVRASWSGTAASTARSTTAPRTPTPAGSKPEQRTARRVPGGSAPSPRPSGRVLSIGAIIDGISARGPPTERRGVGAGLPSRPPGSHSAERRPTPLTETVLPNALRVYDHPGWVWLPASSPADGA
jgi:hypothetical protein